MQIMHDELGFDPEQALELLSASKPDLLIVDSIMPGMDGADLVGRIKADHALRAFQRVNIGAGQTQHVTLTLNPRDLSMVNEEGTRLVAAGAYKLFVGGGQPGAGAAGAELSLTIQGEQKLPR